MWERKQAEKEEDDKDKYHDHHSSQGGRGGDDVECKSQHKATHFQWEPKGGGGAASGKGTRVWTIDGDGKMDAFTSLEDMKYALDRTVDAKVKLRTDRKLVFRDPNPWTYTPEQAAELGLLSEVPKDYREQQMAKKRAAVLNKRHIERHGKPMGYDEDRDDGTELNPGQVEYHRKGKVTTFTTSDMPRDPEDDKEIEDMTEQEYEQWLKDERGWAAWKDDNEKGAGNPYYH